MNWTLNEVFIELTLETGRDWMSLLPYTLYRAKNTPYTLCLTPFEALEVLLGRHPPMMPNLQPDILAEYDQHTFLNPWKSSIL